MITHRVRRTGEHRALMPAGVWCDVISCDWGVPAEQRTLVSDVEDMARAHTRETGHCTHVAFRQISDFERIEVRR